MQCRRLGFDPWVRKIPWRRAWQPTPVLLPGKSHGHRSLAGYSPWGHKESDATYQLSTWQIVHYQNLPLQWESIHRLYKNNWVWLCLTLCDPRDHSLPRSSVHGILQVRLLEWVAMPFSRGSSEPRDPTQISCLAGIFFTFWATKNALKWPNIL